MSDRRTGFVASSRVFALLATAAFTLACAGPGSASSGSQASPPPSAPKTIVIVAGAPVHFVSWNQPTTAGGTLGLNEIFANGLVSNDLAGNREGQLAARLPSLDDGSMTILPDGKLRATWPLRPNVRWHDGAPFTAEDVAFGWRVAADPGVPKPSLSGPAAVQAQLERIEATDPLTVVVTWKTPFYQSLNLTLGNLWPLPRHLLGDAFEGDKEAFRNHPYFSTEFVHLGPFRLVDYGLGENLLLERFDDYFRGRPKVDRIVARIIQDRNTLVANLLAGTIDIAVSGTLPYELIVDIRDTWTRTGDGSVVEKPDVGGFRSLITQMRPDFARPVELSNDVRVRRGLFFALDRHALGEAMVPGATDVVLNTFMDSGDPRSPIIGEPFARYPFDPARALQELTAAGWSRDNGGRLVSRSGEPVAMVVRSTGGGGSEKEIAVIAHFWRDIGFEIAEEILPESQSNNLEVRAKFSAFETTSVTGGETTLGRWDSRIAPTPEGRWAGNNRGGYVNPALDRIIDTIKATLDEGEQGRLLRDGGAIVATDLPAMPLYHGVTAAVVRKGVRALFDDFGGNGSLSRNAHLWDRE